MDVTVADDVVPLAVLRGHPTTTAPHRDARMEERAEAIGWSALRAAPAAGRASDTDWSRPLLHPATETGDT